MGVEIFKFISVSLTCAFSWGYYVLRWIFVLQVNMDLLRVSSSRALGVPVRRKMKGFKEANCWGWGLVLRILHSKSVATVTLILWPEILFILRAIFNFDHWSGQFSWLYWIELLFCYDYLWFCLIRVINQFDCLFKSVWILLHFVNQTLTIWNVAAELFQFEEWATFGGNAFMFNKRFSQLLFLLSCLLLFLSAFGNKLFAFQTSFLNSLHFTFQR